MAETTKTLITNSKLKIEGSSWGDPVRVRVVNHQGDNGGFWLSMAIFMLAMAVAFGCREISESVSAMTDSCQE